jgi:hypothetical protein
MPAVKEWQKLGKATLADDACLGLIGQWSGASELCSRVTIGPQHAPELGSTASTQGLGRQHNTGCILAGLGCRCSSGVCVGMGHSSTLHDVTSGRMRNNVGCETGAAPTARAAMRGSWRQGQRIDGFRPIARASSGLCRICRRLCVLESRAMGGSSTELSMRSCAPT